MNAFVMNTIIRYGLGYIGTALASHGLITAETWQTIVGVATAAIAAGVGAYTSTDRKAVDRVNGIPGVSAVTERGVVIGKDPAGNGS